MAGTDGAEVFGRQAEIARGMGFPFTARLMEAVPRQLAHAPLTAAAVAGWRGDLWADNVPLRLGGGLHALARRGATPALAALYRDGRGDVDAVLAEAMRQEDATLAEWLRSPPQTNEVGRSAALWAAMMVAADRHGGRFELLELGSSAGLNLNLARYGYDLGGRRSGDLASMVVLRPRWRGPPPPPAHPAVLRARGVDLAPLDARDPAARERLSAFVWPDDAERGVRLQHALDLAAEHPPSVDRGDAADWLVERLAEPPERGVVRTVLHSVVLQYLPAERRARVRDAIEAAAGRATAERRLAWISFEWDAARSCAALHLSSWPGGATRELATCQAHAAWIDWTG